ncbi:hypothetical protein Ddc_13650 [Ditylenchus destructor]|nr:hypothetical protein Ddc_13650 [Ditylenchus destructor]
MDNDTSSGFSEEQQPSCSTSNESQSTLSQESPSAACICHDHDFREAGCSHYRAELEQSQKHLTAHLNAIKKLIQTNNGLREKVDDLQKAQDSVEICECKALQVELNGVETELEACRDRSKELEEENAELRTNFKISQEEVSQLKNQLEDVQMNRIVIDEDDEVDATGAQSSQINGLRDQLRKCAADYRQEKKNHDQTAKQLETAQRDLQKLQRDSRNAEASTSSNSALRDQEKLESDLKNCRLQLSVAEENFRKASSEETRLRATLIQAIGQEEALKAEIANLKAELESRSASGDGNSRIQKLSEEVMSLRMSEAKLASELTNAKRELIGVRQQVQQKEDGNYNLAVQLENIKTELETSHKNLNLLEMEKTVLKSQTKEGKLEIDRLKKERSLAVAREFEMQEKVDKFTQKLKETEQALQHSTKMLNRTSNELTQETEAKKAAIKETEKLKSEITLLNDKTKKEQRKRARVNKATVDELQEKIKKLTQELEAGKESGKEVENLQQQIADLRKNYEESEKTVSDLRKEAGKESGKEVESLEKQIADLRKNSEEREKTVLDLENALRLSRTLEYQMGSQLEKCSAELVEIRRLLKETEQTLKDERILRYDAENQRNASESLWKCRMTDAKVIREKDRLESEIKVRNALKLLEEERDRTTQLQKSAQDSKKFENRVKEMEAELKKMSQDRDKLEAGIRELSGAKSATEPENVAKVRAEYEKKVRELKEANSKLAAAKIKEEVDEQGVEKAEAERLEKEKLKESLEKFGDDIKVLQATLTNHEVKESRLKDLLKNSQEQNVELKATISNGEAEVEKLKEEFRKKISELEAEVEILKREQVANEAKIREFSEAKSEAENKSAKVRAEFEDRVRELSEQYAKLAAKTKENEVKYLDMIREIEQKLKSAENESAENDKLVSQLEAELEEASRKEREWEEREEKFSAMKAMMEECFSKKPSSEDRKRPIDNSRTDHTEKRKRRCKSIHPYSTPSLTHSRAANLEVSPQVSAQEVARRRPSEDWQVVSVKPNPKATQNSIQISLPEEKDASPSRDARLTPDSTSNHELAFPSDIKSPMISKQTNFPTLQDDKK